MEADQDSYGLTLAKKPRFSMSVAQLRRHNEKYFALRLRMSDS